MMRTRRMKTMTKKTNKGRYPKGVRKERAKLMKEQGRRPDGSPIVPDANVKKIMKCRANAKAEGCPKDADMIYGKCCSASKRMPKQMIYCTRKARHKGAHHAHGFEGKCFGVWE
jgi:hypothetical protein